MATKTVNKNELPKIDKKWLELKIDPDVMRPIYFSWDTKYETRYVSIYNDNPTVCKPREDIMHQNLRRCVTSYYFVFDEENKRIFAHPVQLIHNTTRSECSQARFAPTTDNVNVYMWDANKQLWIIPKRSYQKWVRYDYTERRAIYETIEPIPYKVNRLSTSGYKVQCQLTDHIRSMFAKLYGSDFVYQNHLVTDNNIRDKHYRWIYWLQAKGRKYSEKTIKETANLMNQFCSESRIREDFAVNQSRHGYGYCSVTIEDHNGIVALCYFSNGKETFRQIFNQKTCKLNDFIWKNGVWTKSSKLDGYQSIDRCVVEDSYRKTHKYDCIFFDEASKYYETECDSRNWGCYKPQYLYKFIREYFAKPVIAQLLQIQDISSRNEMYKQKGDINKIYGDIPNKGRTMFAKLGINKHQFQYPAIIPYMKWLLEEDNISYIDNATWDKCYNVFLNNYRSGDNATKIRDYLKSAGEFSIDRWIKICQLLQNTVGDNRYGYHGISQLYVDYFKSLSAMREFGIDIATYPIIFNNREQLQRYHDEAARAVSSVKNKASDEKISILYGRRLNMLENDGTYLIDMPKCSADLAEEGSKLRHCVGGYASSVANGETAIYFLRQASDPAAPWLTVEVRNKRCNQIHGSCNAWMGSKDEYFAAVPFLVWWFDKHNIECNENLLTNMATGYCGRGNHRQMPTKAIEAYKASHKNKK